MIAVIGGLGYVGQAVMSVLGEKNEVIGIDTKDPESLKHWNHINQFDFVFVCVQTLEANGLDAYDYEQVDSVLDQLTEAGYKGVIVLKSTVAPSYLSNLGAECRRITVHQPEFASAATAMRDMAAQKVRVYGADSPTMFMMVEDLYPNAHEIELITCPLEEAALLKLAHNCYAAVNVSYANEIARLSHALGYDYNGEVRDRLVRLLDGLDRTFSTYASAPGPDGRMGFGGHCLPKDLKALIWEVQSNRINPEMLMGIMKLNRDIRE